MMQRRAHHEHDSDHGMASPNGVGGMSGEVLIATEGNKLPRRRKAGANGNMTRRSSSAAAGFAKFYRNPATEVGTIVCMAVGGCLLVAVVIFGLCKAFLGLSWLGNGGKYSHDRYRHNHGWSRGGGMEGNSNSRDDRRRKDTRLPHNPLYRIPDAAEDVGDRSDRYVEFRKRVDPQFPVHATRSLQRVRELSQREFQLHPMISDTSTTTALHHSDEIPADGVAAGAAAETCDIYDCPDMPPKGYPFAWNMLDILKNWPPDDPTPRSHIYQGLCVFDFETDYDKAVRYRNLELPFVVVNDPAVARTVERWNSPGYMQGMLGEIPHRCEFSENNHFMYYVAPRKPLRHVRANRNNNHDSHHADNGGAPEGWKEPTQLLRMPYAEWLQHANVTEEYLGPDMPHWYFRLIGCGYMGVDGSCDRGSSEYLFDELPFFQPKESLYIVEPEEQKGIHCRFGMKGVIAENHFDGSRNAIALLGGSRRYILAHPNQCSKLALYPKGHPSARHSAVDWSNPNLEQFPEFAQAQGNEVVLQPGQVLYLPTNWFHYIVSLELNFQCNTRSGITPHYMPPIHSCGF